MTTHQPQIKTKNILDTLNKHLYSNGLDAFTKKALMKDISAIKDIDPADGYCLLGVLASVENDIKEMNSNYQNAIKLSPHNSAYNFTYATGLLIFGYYEEAYTQASLAHEKEPANISYLKKLYDISLIIGNMDKVKKHADEWHRITTNVDVEPLRDVLTFSNTMKNIKYFFNEKKLIEKNIERLIDECEPVIRDIFGSPIALAIELANLDDHPELPIAVVIRWPYGWEDGMNKYDKFLDWCVENSIYERANGIFFNIQLIGNDDYV